MSAEQDHVTRQSSAGRHAIGRRALIGLAILTMATGSAASLLYGSIEPGAGFAVDPDTAQRRASLGAITSWRAVTDPAALAGTAHDASELLLIDAAAVETVKRSTVQKAIEQLQVGADGSRRPVMAAVRIASGPDESVLDGLRATVEALQERGFDGVFVDCAQVAGPLRRGKPTEPLVRGLMTLLAQARQVNPTFLVVIENAGDLAADPRLDRMIDGVAKSDLLFGLDGAGVANSRTDVVSALSDLTPVRKSGRAVFVTEHLAPEAADKRAGTRQSLATLGFVVRFAEPRAAR